MTDIDASPHPRPQTLLLAKHQNRILRRLASYRDQSRLHGPWSPPIRHAPLSKEQLHHPPHQYLPRETTSLPPLDIMDHVRSCLGAHISIHRGTYTERRHDDAVEDGGYVLDWSRGLDTAGLVKYHEYRTDQESIL